MRRLFAIVLALCGGLVASVPAAAATRPTGQVDGVSVNPAAGAHGVAISAEVGVSNRGDRSSKPMRLLLKLRAPDGASGLLLTSAKPGRLRAGESRTVDLAAAIPLQAPVGDSTLIACRAKRGSSEACGVSRQSTPLSVLPNLGPIANLGPVANNDSFATDEDTPITTGSLLANDSDPDGDPLNVTALSTAGTEGTATSAAGGTVAYDPDAEFEALDGGQSDTDSFGYTVSDGRGGTATATATITVNGVNDAPVAGGGTNALPENSPNGSPVRTVSATDAEPAQTHAYSIISGNSSGAFAINPTTGAITVADINDLDFETTPSFTLGVRATDNGSPAKSGDATVTVNLTNVNEAPVVTGATASISENAPNGTAVATPTATDPDSGQTLAWSITGGNTGNAFAIDPTTGAITVADTNELDFASTPTYTLTVRATDDGSPLEFDEGTVTVNLTDVAEPSASSGTALVNEAAMSASTGALVTGSNPASGAEEATGNLTYSFGGEGAASTLPFTWGSGVTASDPEGGDPALGALESGGNPVSWTVSSDGLTLTGTANSQTVITAVVTNTSTGAYTVTLLGQLDHPDADQSGSSDQVALAIPYTVKDAIGQTASSNFTVSVNDDGPTTQSQTETISLGDIDTNLLLIIDISGSQTDPSGLTNLTRFDVVKPTLEELIKRYDSAGDVAVRIVTFSTTASAHGSTWESASSARAYIDSLAPNGFTNYDEALTNAEAAFASTGKIAGANNVAYFLSDGVPTQPSGSQGISASEEATWVNFLEANDILSVAVGVSSDAVASALHPVAYDGRNGTNTNAEVYSDLSELPPPNNLAADVDPGLNGAIDGNLIAADGVPGADRPDSLRAIGYQGQTFTYNSSADTVTPSGSGTTTYVFDAPTNVITLTTAAGPTLEVDFDDGAYTYDANGAGAMSQVFAFARVDADGDTTTNNVTFNIAGDFGPITRPDRVFANTTTAAAVFDFEDAWLLYNDIDPDGDPLSVTSVANSLDGTANHAPTTTTFTDNDSDGGTFEYTAQSNALADTTKVTINRAQAGENTLDGTDLADILLSRTTQSTLNGYTGADVLVGGLGPDTLNGGAGDDLLDGRGNSDTYHGAGGDDTVNVSDGNEYVFYSSVLNGTDTVTGFDGNGGVGAQDELNLDALFDSLGVPAIPTRIAQVQVVDHGSTVDVRVDAITSNPDYELHVATLFTTDPITVGSGDGQDVNVGS